MMPSVTGLAPSAKRHFGSSLRSTQGFSSTRSILIAVVPFEALTAFLPRLRGRWRAAIAARRRRECCASMTSVQTVQRARVVVQDALHHALVDAAVLLEQSQRLDLRGSVGMAVIGADD